MINLFYEKKIRLKGFKKKKYQKEEEENKMFTFSNGLE
jgi:hypothetical protein